MLKNADNLLLLGEREPLFVGGTRRCYLYPGDAEKIIKVLREDRTGEERRKKLKSLKRLLPARFFDDQLKELAAYKTLLAQHNPHIWKHVPEFYGTEMTDMGLGIVTKLYRNHDGTYPPNLQQLVPLGMTPELQAAIDEFKTWLKEEVVITRDLLPHNIIAVRQADNSLRLLIVDGLGNSEFIPISTWSKLCGRMKIMRKLKKFRYRIQILLPRIPNNLA